MDILCVKCGESWDSYGANHGDMIAWEYDMLRKGVGCPACKGVKKHNLTMIQHLENETATEGAGVEESNNPYCPNENYIELCCCSSSAGCSNNIEIDADEIYYDGLVKIMYHSQGNVRFNNKKEIENYAVYEHDWELIDNDLYCKECADFYNKCDCCGGIFEKELMIFVQDDRLDYCEDCYSENYTFCYRCDTTVRSEDSIGWEDEMLCNDCFIEITTICEVCDDRFTKDNAEEGPNGEVCCSDKCLEKITRTCEICNAVFSKEDLVDGPNNEICCSEKCADNATEEE